MTAFPDSRDCISLLSGFCDNMMASGNMMGGCNMTGNCIIMGACSMMGGCNMIGSCWQDCCSLLLQDRKTVVLPRKPNALSDARMATVKMLHVLEFNSQTLKSGVVVLSDDAPPGGALLFVRGAPGAIKGLVRPASVPQDFDQVAFGTYTDTHTHTPPVMVCDSVKNDTDNTERETQLCVPCVLSSECPVEAATVGEHPLSVLHGCTLPQSCLVWFVRGLLGAMQGLTLFQTCCCPQRLQIGNHALLPSCLCFVRP